MQGKPNTVTADSAVVTAGGILRGVVLAGGSADATLILYDNASAASGTKLLTLNAKAGDSRVVTGLSIPFSAGVYADIGGTGAVATIYT